MRPTELVSTSQYLTVAPTAVRSMTEVLHNSDIGAHQTVGMIHADKAAARYESPPCDPQL